MDFEIFKAGILSALLIGSSCVFFSLAIWLLMRPVVCWYFKINQNIELLTEIRDLLKKQSVNQNAIIKNLPEDNSRWAPPKKI
ncbi:hypothetical protein [uncultured Desulfobacter sp.]|uniref:hypothetical protein n=1 Tax=uncultured Desulfobacter sp. TaxID=240139 RepID=UPI0029F46257|nr:hypothetical protein [uncultured Desulfobacter sp.]